MRTTVIGSYPLRHDELGPAAIVQAVEEQLAAGVQLVSDGQTRGDMISVYAGALDGTGLKGEGAEKKLHITGKIGLGDPSELVGDFALARRTAGERAEVKAVLTGPVTLAFSSILETPEYKGYRDKRLYLDLSDALLGIAKRFAGEGARHFQIDEPFFSVGVPMDIAQEAVESLATRLDGEVALHVCGDVSKVFGRLLHFKGIGLLSHAFAGNGSNLGLLERRELEEAGKRLGFGCIDTASETVEDAKGVLALVRKGIGLVGRENMVLHPDCGMRALPHAVARAKLESMCAAARTLDGER